MSDRINLFVVAVILLSSALAPTQIEAATLAERFRGQIFLQVDAHGEAWYVYPDDLARYYLGRPDDAFLIMRRLGLGASSAFIAANEIFPAAVSGKILLDVEANGEAYYIYPQDRKKYYLGRPADAFRIMRQLSTGITTDNLAAIPVGRLSGADATGIPASSYEIKTVVAMGRAFSVKIVMIDLAPPDLRIVADTASDGDCDTDCPVRPLASYAEANQGFAAISGSYFCPAGSASCVGAGNYFFYPVYNSRLGKMINADQLRWPTTGPLLVFDTANRPYFFLNAQEFKDVATFEAKYDAQIQAALGNKPALVHQGQNIVSSQELEEGQKTLRSHRSAIGIKGSEAYLVVAANATVIDLAGIMTALGMDEAMNLDSGGSAALYYEGSYRVGPGRDIPNALVFSTQ